MADNVLQGISLRRDPYIVESDKDADLLVVSRIIIPSVDGFFCCLFELPLMNSSGSSIEWLMSGERQWIFAGSIQQISIPQFGYDPIVTWKGYGDFSYHHSYKFAGDSNIELVLVDDEFSGVLNLVTSWFLLSPHITLTYKNVYRPSLDEVQGIIYERLSRKEIKGIYKGNLLVLCFTPSVELTFAMLFLNVFPTQLPLNSLQLDVSNIQIRLLNTSFSYDKLLCGPEIVERVKSQPWYRQVVDLITLGKGNTQIGSGSCITSPLGAAIEEYGVLEG